MSSEAEKFCAKFKSPEDSIKWLLTNAKMSVEEFFKTKWQNGAFSMHADEEYKDLAKIFSYDFLLKVSRHLALRVKDNICQEDKKEENTKKL